MKLTYSLRKFIYSELYKYSEQLGLTIDEVPDLVFTRKELIEISKSLEISDKIILGKLTVTRRYYGITYKESNIIFLNIKIHNTRKELIKTIVHELIHLRFQKMKHGTKYEERIKNILNGKKYLKS